ncbi:hypothetical protein OG883_16260 [Streptomyces sp. NBC_01142]|uniref:hypothetical protein n=1 Tax=Streptomyces sp. NBC_01142 TaxID=2975865 RepID=UPI002253DC00|nr:hypothetical protein [Streptomyces sp. NBC_01142]MCX4821430.1 hypothetical protein [Streptomyces sp. NBC_01142]
MPRDWYADAAGLTDMTGFFQALASQLAAKWVSLLLLPGALFTATAWIAAHLGHAHALDVGRLDDTVSVNYRSLSHGSTGAQILTVIVFLLAATGVGLVVQALAGPTRALWLGRWPGWAAARLVRHRRNRWNSLVQRRRSAAGITDAVARQAAVDAAAARINRMALAEPGRPTWMGDRIHAVEQVSFDRYGLDLTFCWSRLWLVLPDSVRTEITVANSAFAGAVAVGAWTVPYLGLACVWWPAAVVAVFVGVTGWARGRSAVADLGALAEAAVDLHGRSLAQALGVGGTDATMPLDTTEGKAVTDIVRKGR